MIGQLNEQLSFAVFQKLKSLDQTGTEQTTAEQIENVSPVKTEPPKTKAKTENWGSLTSRISNATTVSELLQLSDQHLNQQNAMAIITKLSVWTASNQVRVKDFENDYRFLKICQVLSKVEVAKDFKSVIHKDQQKSAELEMVLSIAGDDEASKIVESLSLPQKVRVFSSLARKKTRSIPVLKTLASTISAHTGKLNLKECSDLLFAMTNLNFIDEMLLSRISIDINDELDRNVDKTAVVGSIVTSMGFMKFKDPLLLDNLTKWIIDKQDLCRPKDLASLILTLALVNYRPTNVDELKSKVIPKISRDDLSASEWLDFVWALAVLELHQSNHFESILRPDFLNDVTVEQGTDVLPAQKMKILNINTVAKHLTSNYDGPFLQPDSPVHDCLLGHRKSKKILIQGLLDTLKNLFTDNSYIRIEHNTNLGFIIGKY